ncbi:hypothetical protein ACQY0O_000411 [Thecaphora frezii]
MATYSTSTLPSTTILATPTALPSTSTNAAPVASSSSATDRRRSSSAIPAFHARHDTTRETSIAHDSMSSLPYLVRRDSRASLQQAGRTASASTSFSTVGDPYQPPRRASGSRSWGATASRFEMSPPSQKRVRPRSLTGAHYDLDAPSQPKRIVTARHLHQTGRSLGGSLDFPHSLQAGSDEMDQLSCAQGFRTSRRPSAMDRSGRGPMASGGPEVEPWGIHKAHGLDPAPLGFAAPAPQSVTDASPPILLSQPLRHGPTAREDPLSAQLLTQRTAVFFEHLYRDLCVGIFPRAYIYPKIGQNWQRQDAGFAALALSMSVLGLMGVQMPAPQQQQQQHQQQEAAMRGGLNLSPLGRACSPLERASPTLTRRYRSVIESLDVDAPFRPPTLPRDGTLAPTTEQREQIVSLISLTLSTRAMAEGTASFGQQPGCASIMTSFFVSLALWCLQEGGEATSWADSPTSPASTWRDASFLRFSESVTLAKILGLDRLAEEEMLSARTQPQQQQHDRDDEARERMLRTWALLVRAERWWASQGVGYRPQLSVPSGLSPVHPPATTAAAATTITTTTTTLPALSTLMQGPYGSTRADGSPQSGGRPWRSETSLPPIQLGPSPHRRSGVLSAPIVDWIRSSASASEVTTPSDSPLLPQSEKEGEHPAPSR